ncbi:DUF5701 family protein [Rhodococcus sp. IEGM 1408]|uniref:DUF5701 family protein n=1 Tax=Rhodococcus sp. IEGM 1408 TaxID=3082220 RepID=UPI002952A934|nr:DUF5701 family protein [Rhodococcus sp. IEGM 1408]MDV8001159.1 DUF5701 family protein [Rhodococcus sp. IEGM 1408]
MTPATHPEPIHPGRSVAAQAERLVELGVPGLAGISAGRLHEYAAALPDPAHPGPALPADPGTGRVVLAVHPSLVSTARLATLLSREGKAGFVVVDMSDLADFSPTDDVHVPDAPLYLVGDVTRDDDLLDRAPTDAHAELGRRARTPLTISEGVSWLLQAPEMLEPGKCFMCIGSRKRKVKGGLDSRTPALWISGGTGRDGRQNKGAPKVGWCWAGNHHTWLGFASTSGRMGPG